MNIDFVTLKKILLSYLNSLKQFHFDFLNPLFWIFLFVLFLILARLWYTKKSFSFCLIIAIILLATTKLENLIKNFFFKSGESFDTTIIRALSALFILLISMYYFIIRED